MDSNLTDRFDMTSLKQQALQFAAEISPNISPHGGITIGPLAIDKDDDDGEEDPSTPLASPTRLTKDDDDNDDDQWDRTYCSDSSRFDLNCSTDLENAQSVTHRITMGELQKLNREMAQAEMRRRSNQHKQLTEQYRLKIAQESDSNLAEKSALLKKTYDDAASVALVEWERKERGYAEEENRKRAEESRRKEDQDLILQRQEKRAQMDKCLDVIQMNQRKMRDHHQSYLQKISAVMDTNLKSELNLTFRERISEILNSFDVIIASMKSLEITEVEMNKSSDLVNRLAAIHKEIDGLIQGAAEEKANAAAAAAVAAAEMEQRRAAAAQAPQPAASVPDVVPVGGHQEFPGEQIISPRSWQIYSELEDFRASWEESLKPLTLTTDPQLKRFMFDCKYAVNVPVAAISNASREHFGDKLSKLQKLLKGESVPCKGGTVDANQHPLGIAYCMNLLASQFVHISTRAKNPNVFSFAAVIVSLSHRHPEFKKLFLAHVYKRSPYVVPYFIPRTEGQSTEEYNRVRGLVETTMEETMRLYAAVLVSRPRRGESNPYSLADGWRWLAEMMNHQPEFGVSGTLINLFLTIAGSHMQRAYGGQFRKLVALLRGKYMELLLQNPEVEVGHLQTLLSQGGFEEPQGMLPNDF